MPFLNQAKARQGKIPYRHPTGFSIISCRFCQSPSVVHAKQLTPSVNARLHRQAVHQTGQLSRPCLRPGLMDRLLRTAKQKGSGERSVDGTAVQEALHGAYRQSASLPWVSACTEHPSCCACRSCSHAFSMGRTPSEPLFQNAMFTPATWP